MTESHQEVADIRAVNHLVHALYGHCKNAQEQDAINRIIEELDTWLLESKWSMVDLFLQEFLVRNAPLSVNIAVLSAAFPARDRLEHYDGFIARIEGTFTFRCTNKEELQEALAPWQSKPTEGTKE